MKVYGFPGQGSQGPGMGGDLFDRFPELTRVADSVLGYSIKELCLHDPQQKLNDTRYTQPAMYVVNALTYVNLVENNGDRADYLIGHSLGELSALFAAGAFSFEQGLEIVAKRGELMSHVSGGAMAAIMNCSEERIEQILAEHALSSIDIANYNAPDQIVISGLQEDMALAEKHFRAMKVRFYPLNTSGAFHSKWMRGVAQEFGELLESIELAPLQVPVIANYTARPYKGNDIAHNLTRQIANPVRWYESVKYLLQQGPMQFRELGQGDVLSRLVDRIRKDFPDAESRSAVDRAPASDTSRRDPPQRDSLSVAEKVEQWNRRHPVGTKVRSELFDRDGLQTRTPAIVLFGCRAAVYLNGFSGYFDLDELSVAP